MARVSSSLPPALGAGGPEFKSRRPDQFMFFVFCHLEIVAFCHHNFATVIKQETQKGRSAIQNMLKWCNFNEGHAAGEGKTGGTLSISRSVDFERDHFLQACLI